MSRRQSACRIEGDQKGQVHGSTAVRGRLIAAFTYVVMQRCLRIPLLLRQRSYFQVPHNSLPGSVTPRSGSLLGVVLELSGRPLERLLFVDSELVGLRIKFPPSRSFAGRR